MHCLEAAPSLFTLYNLMGIYILTCLLLTYIQTFIMAGKKKRHANLLKSIPNNKMMNVIFLL